MSVRGLGGNRQDAITAALALVVLASALAPGALDAVGAGAPQLVHAAVEGNLLILTFSAPLEILGDAWFDGVNVTVNDVPVTLVGGQQVAQRSVRVMMPGGAFVDDDVRVRIAEGTPLVPDGVPATGPVRAVTSAPRTSLPSPRAFAEPTFIDGEVYVFGGLFGYYNGGGQRLTDQIVHYDPATEKARIVDARLPVPVWRHTVSVDPRSTDECPRGCAYVFGGLTYAGAPAPAPWDANDVDDRAVCTILRFEPVSGSVTVMDSRLGEERPGESTGCHEVAVAWTGDAFVLMGGWRVDSDWDPRGTDLVRVYDPVNDSLTTLNTRLPWGVAGADAFFDARPTLACPRGCAYALLGVTTHPVSGAWFDAPSEALRFEPVTGTVLPVGGRAGPDTSGVAPKVAWTGSAAFNVMWPDSWLRFDPADASWSLHAPPRWAVMGDPGLAADGRDVWVIGNEDGGNGDATRGFVRTTPE